MFNAKIPGDPYLSDSHRITYFQNSVTGKAKDAINGLSQSAPSSSTTLLKILRDNSANPFYLVSAQLDILQAWPSPSVADLQTFVYNWFKSSERMISLTTSHQLQFCLQHETNFQLSLSSNGINAITNVIQKPSLIEFTNWIHTLAQACEGLATKPTKPLKKNTHRQTVTATTCLLCQQSQHLRRCRLFLEKTIDARH